MPKESEKYIEAVGRRKTSVARVRITPASKNAFVINDKSLDEYFPVQSHQNEALAPLEAESVDGKYNVSVKVSGGGIHSQVGAVILGLSRALVEAQAESRKELKKAGFLKRDPRMKERRKFGLKKARKSPQWSKR